MPPVRAEPMISFGPMAEPGILYRPEGCVRHMDTVRVPAECSCVLRHWWREDVQRVLPARAALFAFVLSSEGNARDLESNPVAPECVHVCDFCKRISCTPRNISHSGRS
jgi:hypothetical protein